MSDIRIENNDRRTDEEIQLRRLFFRKIYLLASLFVVAVLVQWLWLFEGVHQNAFLEIFMLCAGLWMLLSCLVTALCFPGILMKSPANWIFIGVIVEAFTFVMLGFADIGTVAFCVIVAINIIAMAALVIIASKMPCDLTKIEVRFYGFGIFILVSVVGIPTMFLFPYFNVLAYFIGILILALVIMFTMYYAQLIQGGRYNEMELNQVPFAALVAFCSLMVMNIWLIRLSIRITDHDE